MEYTVVTNPDKSEFIAEVNAKIKEGWTPLGGVAHSMVQYEIRSGVEFNLKAISVYSQALTK